MIFLSSDFLRAAIVDAVAVGRFDLGQVCRAAQVIIGGADPPRQGWNLLTLLPTCTFTMIYPLNVSKSCVFRRAPCMYSAKCHLSCQ